MDRRGHRTIVLPAKLHDTGESGAAAGYGSVGASNPSFARKGLAAVRVSHGPVALTREPVRMKDTASSPAARSPLQPLPHQQTLAPPLRSSRRGDSARAQARNRAATLKEVMHNPEFGDPPLDNGEDSGIDVNDQAAGDMRSRNRTRAGGGDFAAADKPMGGDDSNCTDDDSSDDSFNLSPRTDKSQSKRKVSSTAAREPDWSGMDASSATATNEVNSKEKAGGAAAEEKKSQHQRSADKTRGKAYMQWAKPLLQRACTHRHIPRMSTERDKQVLASALETLDKDMKRKSPFFDDLQAIVDGALLDSCCCVLGQMWIFKMMTSDTCLEFESWTLPLFSVGVFRCVRLCSHGLAVHDR